MGVDANITMDRTEPMKYGRLLELSGEAEALQVMAIQGVCRSHELWMVDDKVETRWVYVVRPTEGQYKGLKRWHDEDHVFIQWTGTGFAAQKFAADFVFTKAWGEVEENSVV